MSMRRIPYLGALFTLFVLVGCDELDATDAEPDLDAEDQRLDDDELDATDAEPGLDVDDPLDDELDLASPTATRAPPGDGPRQKCRAKCSSRYQGCMTGAGARCFGSRRGCLQHQWDLCEAKLEGCTTGCNL